VGCLGQGSPIIILQRLKQLDPRPAQQIGWVPQAVQKLALSGLPAPQPKPNHLRLVFAKDGYRAEEPVSVSSDRHFDTDMVRLQ
jgi:hypothetical protein